LCEFFAYGTAMIIQRLASSDGVAVKVFTGNAKQFPTSTAMAQAFTSAVVLLSVFAYCRLLVTAKIANNLITAILYLVFHASAWRTAANIKTWERDAPVLLEGNSTAAKLLKPQQPKGIPNAEDRENKTFPRQGGGVELTPDGGDDQFVYHPDPFSQSVKLRQTPQGQPKGGQILGQNAAPAAPVGGSGKGSSQNAALDAASSANEPDHAVRQDVIGKGKRPAEATVEVPAEPAGAVASREIDAATVALATKLEASDREKLIAQLYVADIAAALDRFHHLIQPFFHSIEVDDPDISGQDGQEKRKLSTILLTSISRKAAEEPAFKLASFSSIVDPVVFLNETLRSVGYQGEVLFTHKTMANITQSQNAISLTRLSKKDEQEAGDRKSRDAGLRAANALQRAMDLGRAMLACSKVTYGVDGEIGRLSAAKSHVSVMRGALLVALGGL
jgi:hypothetical protein